MRVLSIKVFSMSSSRVGNFILGLLALVARDVLLQLPQNVVVLGDLDQVELIGVALVGRLHLGQKLRLGAGQILRLRGVLVEAVYRRRCLSPNGGLLRVSLSSGAGSW